MSDKKEQLKKSLSVLGITLGESGQSQENQGSDSKVLKHLDTVQKSLSAALTEMDKRLDAAESKSDDVVQKSLQSVASSLDEKFVAMGHILKDIHEGMLMKSQSAAISELSDTVNLLAEAMVETKQTIDGIAENEQSSRAFQQEVGYLQKSFGGEPVGGGGEQKRVVSLSDKNSVLQLLDQASEVVKKSIGEESAAAIEDMAVEYEASGQLTPEMINVIQSRVEGVSLTQ